VKQVLNAITRKNALEDIRMCRAVAMAEGPIANKDNRPIARSWENEKIKELDA
jgi:hypothetical protein